MLLFDSAAFGKRCIRCQTLYARSKKLPAGIFKELTHDNALQHCSQSVLGLAF